MLYSKAVAAAVFPTTHDAGFMHRDVALHTIVVHKDIKVRFIDLEVAKSTSKQNKYEDNVCKVNDATVKIFAEDNNFASTMPPRLSVYFLFLSFSFCVSLPPLEFLLILSVTFTLIFFLKKKIYI